mmetsp:Transcript_41474/g.47841  ORF Transcript_41474/g.47841 Transcript_41474/m.47841 type:complete len:174 (-) Transcript_41474:85-606(-)
MPNSLTCGQDNSESVPFHNHALKVIFKSRCEKEICAESQFSEQTANSQLVINGRGDCNKQILIDLIRKFMNQNYFGEKGFKVNMLDKARSAAANFSSHDNLRLAGVHLKLPKRGPAHDCQAQKLPSVIGQLAVDTQAPRPPFRQESRNRSVSGARSVVFSVLARQAAARAGSD